MQLTANRGPAQSNGFLLLYKEELFIIEMSCNLNSMSIPTKKNQFLLVDILYDVLVGTDVLKTASHRPAGIK